jgi:hypothetical protein
MGVDLASRDDASVLDALSRAGLELRESDGEAGTEFLVSGNTWPNKDLLRGHGGRWSRRRQGWVFPSIEPLQKLATALPANGHAAANGGSGGGLADAPAAYSAERPRPRWRRREHYHGHRERLRSRFLDAGPQALPDYELLELLLFFSIEVKDTKPLAKELLARFGSLGGALGADAGLLAEFSDLRANSEDFLMFQGFARTEQYQRDRELPPEQRSEPGRRWLAYEESDEGRLQADLYWRRRRTEVLFRLVRELMAPGAARGDPGAAGDRLLDRAPRLSAGRAGARADRAVPGPVPRSQERPDQGRDAAARHGRPHAALSARDRKARAGASRLGDHHGAQPPERRPDPLPGRRRDDEAGRPGARGHPQHGLYPEALQVHAGGIGRSAHG